MNAVALDLLSTLSNIGIYKESGQTLIPESHRFKLGSTDPIMLSATGKAFLCIGHNEAADEGM